MLEELTSKPIDPKDLLMLACAFPYYWYHVDSAALSSLVFRYLALPVTIVVVLLCARFLPGWGDPSERFTSLLLTLLFAGTAIVLSGAYVVGLNAWLGQQQPVELSGEITDMRVAHGRVSTSWYVTFRDNATGQTYTLDVGESSFIGLERGDFYSEQWTRGSLGLLYRRN